LPQFTSCCPAWVKFAEQYYPDMLPNLSSCKSPQQMFGSLAKDKISRDRNIPRENIVCVSIMPCTAKKFEAKREEFAVNGNPDVDYVLTTQELALMIKERGIDFGRLDPSSFDMPFGFKTGAGVIFGTSGGVSEAVLRYAADKLGRGMNHEFHQLRYNRDLQAVEVEVAGINLRLAIVSGLANARRLMDDIRSGKEHFDLVEVMACCGGCVNGGGQPPGSSNGQDTLYKRSKGLYDNDKMLQFHNASENYYLRQIYDQDLTDEHKTHSLLHTAYHNRKRISGEDIELSAGTATPDLELKICFGTSCFLRGAQKLYGQLMEYVREQGLEERTQFTASFCSEQCKRGPVLTVNGTMLEKCDIEKAKAQIALALAVKK
ncbi:MAG: ferredoxin, partial [Clostridia bacterium]|nr:ferredoxin [Clostridia bacterium]